MWLDSCNSVHEDSQFDIIVWQPAITIITEGATTTIKHLIDNKIEQSKNDPLTVLKECQTKFFDQFTLSHELNVQKLPFLTGALGYFSYDLGRRFEQLPQQAIKDIDIPEMAVGIYSHAIIFDNKNEQYYLVCPESNRKSIVTSLVKGLENKRGRNELQRFSLKSSWQADITKSEYQEKFQQVQDYLLSGDCYQINLTQRFSSHYQGDEFNAYIALRHENKAPFSAFLRFEKTAILSISPERFLQVNGNKVQSKPIKGTMPRGFTPDQDAINAEKLASSTKDKAENLMIVDLLRNDISKVCQPGTVKVPSLFAIESFPAVHHLVSTVEGKLADEFDASDLIRAGFPGGSITGAPKIRAMEIIEELEPHRRSIYCGSIGYISTCGNMDTSITIRTLICQKHENGDKKIHCWAGGGIVADSEVSAEYQETFDKVNKILPVLSKL